MFNSTISFLLLSNTPSTSVNKRSLFTFNVSAINPAATSALILYLFPLSSKPIGETIGTLFLLIADIRLFLSNLIGFPTKPILPFIRILDLSNLLFNPLNDIAFPRNLFISLTIILFN